MDEHRHPMLDSKFVRGVILVTAWFLISTAGGVRSGEAGQFLRTGMEQLDMDHEHAAGAVDSMRPHEHHVGPHMKWTTLRPPNTMDDQRADEIVQILRQSIGKYKDYRLALEDGFIPMHPERKAKHYHFANKSRRLLARLRFDPAAPTSLLYKKTADGYELEGAMYTAPRDMSEDQLNERIPLSVTQWHAHVNICLEPDGSGRRITRRQFGFKGTIADESECRQAGGRFVPQAGGWMIHVYPFESSPVKIWTH